MIRAAAALSRVSTALRRQTDHRRWADSRNLDESWRSRTRRAAELIPDHSRVIEFGAGNRLLEQHLTPGCRYQPSDLVDRGPGTLVCDLNQRPLPDLASYDVAVALGVLEYLHDIPSVLDWLGRRAGLCIVSYACATPRRNALHRRYDAALRLSYGWINTFTEDELLSLFDEHGFHCTHAESWKTQRIFVFTRQPHTGEPKSPDRLD